MLPLGFLRVYSPTVVSVLTHTCRWTPKSMGYYRVWVLAELVPDPFFW